MTQDSELITDPDIKGETVGSSVLERFFHAWERRLVAVTKDRIVRPFEWGLDWIPQNGSHPSASPAARVRSWVSDVMADTDTFFAPPRCDDYRVTSGADGSVVTFASALVTPHAENNTVYCQYFPARTAHGVKPSAVLVLPQWNASPDGHVGLCRLLARCGMSALRLSLPYHDRRMPAELHRADFIVSSNVVRTVQVCRQAVLDARRAIAWLHASGHERIGILGTSLGSCLALLTTAHEPLVRAQALNHISPYFADVVWRGISTEHVRRGLEGHVTLDELRDFWQPISPRWYVDRVRDRQTLLVYAKYDLTFPVDLSRDLVHEFRERSAPHDVVVLGCGHYSTGKAPFKFVDGWVLTRFLRRALS